MDWSGNLVGILVTAVPGGLFTIVADGFRAITVPRREPWGPSEFVNGFVVEHVDDREVSISLEMQSGDRIEVICERFRVTRPPGSR